MLNREIIIEWFARLPKGYATHPYSKEELNILREVLIENDLDPNQVQDTEETPEQPVEPKQSRFRGKTADFMESPEALSSFIISRYTDGVVKIKGFDKLHSVILGLTPSRLQAVTKMIYENTNRELINGTFKMGDNERLLLKLILNSLTIEKSNHFNLFLAIIYDGKITAVENSTDLQSSFTVAEQIQVATHTNFNSQIISLGVITPDLKNKLDILKGIYKLIRNREISDNFTVSEINEILKELNNPNVQQEIQNLLTNARSSNIESMKALAQQIQTTLDSTSVENLVAEFIRDVDSVIRLKLQDINYIITVTKRMVYVKPIGKIYSKLKPTNNIPNSIMDFNNGMLNLNSNVLKDLILEIKLDTKKLLENVNFESLIKEWFARLPKGFAEYPYTEEETNVLREVLNESDDIRKKVVDTIKALDPTEDNTKDLLSRIYRLLNTETYQNKFSDAIKKSASDDNVINNDRVIKDVSKILLNMPASLDDIQLLIEELENTGTVINISELQKPANTLDNIFKSNVKSAALVAFKALSNYGSGRGQAGPGEYALSILSKDINLSSGKGDIVIGNDLVELKVDLSSTGSGGGRLGVATVSNIQYFKILDKYKEHFPILYDSIMSSRGKSKSLTVFVRDFLAENNSDNSADVLYNIIYEITTLHFGDKYAKQIASTAKNTMDPIETLYAYVKANFDYYKEQSGFDKFLVIGLAKEKVICVSNSDDLISLIKQRHIANPSVGLIPTAGGVVREPVAQITLR